MPHGQDIRLAGAAGEGGDGEVQLIGSAFERRMVGQNAAAGGFVRVEDDPRMVPEQVPRHPDGFVDLVGGGGSRGVLEADRIVGDAGVENPAQNGFIELHGMADAPRGQFHHGDGDFVLQARFRNAGPAVEEVVHVVQGVEIADCGDAVFFHQLSMQLDDVARLAVEPDHIDAAGEGLEVGAVSDNAAEIIHHAERILVAVEISGLKQRAAAGLEMGDSCRGGLFHHRQKIRTEDAGAEYRLESVAEGSQHKVNFFHHYTLYFYFLGMNEQGGAAESVRVDPLRSAPGSGIRANRSDCFGQRDREVRLQIQMQMRKRDTVHSRDRMVLRGEWVRSGLETG